MIDIKQFLILLNGDLMREWSAGIQYEQHAAIIGGSLFAFADSVLREHAQEEFGHARKLMDEIVLLRGIPTIETSVVKTSNDSKGLIQIDLESELDARARYTERIMQARELNLPATEYLLMSIIADEQHHANDLQNILTGNRGNLWPTPLPTM